MQEENVEKPNFIKAYFFSSRSRKSCYTSNVWALKYDFSLQKASAPFFQLLLWKGSHSFLKIFTEILHNKIVSTLFDIICLNLHLTNPTGNFRPELLFGFIAAFLKGTRTKASLGDV